MFQADDVVHVQLIVIVMYRYGDLLKLIWLKSDMKQKIKHKRRVEETICCWFNVIYWKYQILINCFIVKDFYDFIGCVGDVEEFVVCKNNWRLEIP